ncbi:MAG: methyltransferase [Candidatus Nitrosoglobus sp.]
MTHKQPSNELDLDSFFLICAGHTAFQLLWAGVELGLYDLLSKNPESSFDEIANSLNLEPQPTRVLLTGLTVLRIIKKNGRQYTNAKLTEQMLVSNKPDSFAPVLGWQRYIVYEGLIDFVDSLRKNDNIGLRRFPGQGDTLYQRLVSDPFRERVFQDAMSALSHQANSCLRNLEALKNMHHIVDAGGGDGTNGILLCKNYPNIKVSIFDSESVCKIAAQRIEKEGLSERIKTWPGNFFHDPFPEDIDAILYSHILTIWSPKTNLALLKRTYEALPEGGSVIIFNMMGADDDSGPISTALGSPYFQAIATGDGMLYSGADYEGWLKAAGFLTIERHDQLPLNHIILIGKK